MTDKLYKLKKEEIKTQKTGTYFVADGDNKKKSYAEYTREELIKEIEKLGKRKKYGIVWEDKPEQVAELCKEKLPVLEEDRQKEIKTKKGPVNILIEGDNYHALSVLNYTHKGEIDVIYIDPPYNTGARDWKYNNDYVDAQDPYRHSKWLSFMEKRLKLAKNLLKSDGIICVTVDDNEAPRLWCLMDEIFDEKNYLGTIVIRNNPKGRKTERKVSLIHEYAIFYGKNPSAKIKKLAIAPEDKTHNYKKDSDGSWYLPVNLRKQGVDSLAIARVGKISERYYPIYFDDKTGRLSTKVRLPNKILPIDINGEKRIWRRGKDVIDEMYNRGDLWPQKTRYGIQIYFKFRGGLDGEPPESIWFDSKFSASEHGTQMLDKILGKREVFQYPKSPYAVSECIKVASTNKDSIILDFFAGSGTTGQSVLELNQEDEGNRKFILCTNNENNICTEVCYPRIEKVIKGYTADGKKRDGLGGNLKYFKTDFVDAEPTDKNKEKLVDKSTEMLCLKEDCFDELDKGQAFRIFTNSQNKLLGIIYDDDGIVQFKKEVKKMNKKFIVYVFSLDESAREEEFEDIKDLVELRPIPAVILNVYRRIFK